MKIREMFNSGVERLKLAGIPDPELEASLLLAGVLGISRTSLLLAGDRDLDEGRRTEFERNLARRLQREPLAYILEEKEFWSLPFRVTGDVLIPRPETELLIDTALGRLQELQPDPGDPHLRILDLGTGSGIIAVVLARELKRARITAVDLSYKALQVAVHNARRHGVAGRIDFINSNWLAGLSLQHDFHLVLANPPYVADSFFSDSPRSGGGRPLQPEVADFEPRLALNGGERGLDQIREIAGDLSGALRTGGWFFMEFGADQAEEVAAIFEGTGTYDNIAVVADYAGLPRIFQARKV